MHFLAETTLLRPPERDVVKNVLHLIDTFGTGGAETIYLRLATGLDPARFRSVAAILDRGWLYDSLVANGMQPLLITSQRGFDLGFLRQIAQIVRSHRIDLIHTHLLTTSVYGGAVGRLLRVPVVSTYHGVVDFNSAYLSVKRRVVGLAVSRIVFVSDHLRQQIAAGADFGLAKSHVIHNGVDVTKFAPARDLTWRRSQGIRDDEFLIGGVGRIVETKGFDVLLRAVARLRSTDRKFRAVIVGDSDPGRDLVVRLGYLSAELGIADAVQFLPFHDAMPAVYNSLDLLALTSRSEGFSLVTVEAMACGLPVIATKCGGPEEILTDGWDGLMVGVGDDRALAEAVARVAADSTLRVQLGERARQTAESQFSLDTMLRKYEEMYSEQL